MPSMNRPGKSLPMLATAAAVSAGSFAQTLRMPVAAASVAVASRTGRTSCTLGEPPTHQAPYPSCSRSFATQLGRKREERCHVLPGVQPRLRDHREARSPFVVEGLERRLGGVGVDGGGDRLQVSRDLLALAPRHVPEAVPDQMHHARLYDRVRVDRLDRLWKAFEPVDAAEQDVREAALLELAQDLHPELRALALLEPHPEHVPLTLDRDAEREVAGSALYRPALADLQHQRVEEDDRVDVIERALLPLADVVHDGVGDAADQVAADLDAVDLGQVRLDVARREPARVEREDLVVEALETPPPLPDDLRLEAAPAIPRRLDPHRPVLGRKRLRRRTVAGVAGAAGRPLMGLVAEMLCQLRRHRPLHEPLGQLREYATGADDLLLGPGAREQLVDHLVGKAIADRFGKLKRLAAGRPLRSPSGLRPRPAGALNQISARLRRHDAPSISSCLHRRSDSPRFDEAAVV